jgi:hypothetical protein
MQQGLPVIVMLQPLGEGVADQADMVASVAGEAARAASVARQDARMRRARGRARAIMSERRAK